MEESSEVQYEENKELPDKNKRRRFKTPSQLQALEEFYNEHKYPTESMKADLAEKLGLTEKQVSGWFCHRRLKDKRHLKDEANATGRQDLSSGVVQDRGSGLKQDSCSSTKQGDYWVADLREVESQRFSRDDLASAELNYEVRRLDDGTEIDDTSSESNSDLQESFYPKNRNTLEEETTKYRVPNGYIAKESGRVGPSGYLKIKGQTENAAITAVKRQLGRLYREDGPPLGIEFDPLPPGAFELLSKNTNNDAYIAQEPSASGSGIHKRPGPGNLQRRKQDMYIGPTDSRPLLKTDHGDFPPRQPKKKPSFPNHSLVFPSQKSSIGVNPYSTGEISEYEASKNQNIQRNRNLSGKRHDPFIEYPQSRPHGGKVTGESEEPWSQSPTYGSINVNSKVPRRRDWLDSRQPPSSLTVRPKDPVSTEDRITPNRITKQDEGIYMERRPMAVNNDHRDSSIKSNKRPSNELRAGKKARGEFLPEDYAMRTSSQELHQWSRQIKGPTAEMPSSFSEDETAETSSSVD